VKFDAYAGTLAYKPEHVWDLFRKDLGLDLERRSPKWGFDAAVIGQRGQDNPIWAMWGKKYSGTWVSCQGPRSPEFVQIIREHMPVHGVSRADVCEDYTNPGAWDFIVSTALALADELSLSVRHVGDWHRAEKGRTLYLGSRDSPYFVRIYEKGKQLGADPHWVRVEVELKPASKDKERWSLASPQQVAYAVPWGREFWARLGHLEPDRVIQVPPPPPKNLESRTLALVAQYGRVILDLAEHHQGDLSRLGEHLVRSAIANRYENRAAASEASALFFREGDEV
jgi:hypothetical protein